MKPLMRPAAYPALFAAWLVLVQWRQSGAAWAHGLDLATSGTLAIALGAAGWAIAGPLVDDRDRRAMLALLPVLWGSFYSTFATAALRVMPLRPAEGALLWTALLLLLAVAVRKLPVNAGVTRALTLTAALLLVMQGAGIVGGRAPVSADGSIAATDARKPTTPDIHVLVLDKYTSSEWLQRTFGVDNGSFEDSLRALGFVVPARARTNYTHTGLVLASMLDGQPVHERLDGRGGWPQVFARIEDGRMIHFLRDRGYRFFFFPTTYRGTLKHALADRVLTRPVGPARRSAFHTWLAHAPVRSLRAAFCPGASCMPVAGEGSATVPFPIETADEIEWKFATAATLADSAGPIVSLTHILAPHDPYQFDAECGRVEPWWPHTDEGVDTEIRAAYAAQVRCINTLTLRTVRALIARATVPPVIIVQGDHGHGRFARDIILGQTVPRAELADDQVAERMSVFAAYRTPGLAIPWPDTITPVNVMPRILNAQFGATFVLHPDRSWWVDRYSEPLRVESVAPAVFSSGNKSIARSSKR